MSFLCMILDWIAKIIEDKNALLKKCEDILFVITDKTDILDFLWIHVWEQVIINFFYVFYEPSRSLLQQHVTTTFFSAFH